MSNVFVFRQPPSGFHPEYFGGGGKGGTTTQSVSIPPEVLARYNSVNARAEETAKQPFQAYGGEFVAPLTSTQQAGIQGTNAAANMAQPFYGAATQQLLGAQQGGANYINAATNQLGQAQDVGQGLALGALGSYQQAGAASSPYYRAATQGTQAALAGAQPYQQMATQAALAGAQGISPGQLQTEQYMSPYTQNVVEATRSGLRQQFGQQAAQQQAEAIKAGAFGGDRAGLQRQMLRGQQALAESQAISPLYQQAYNQALQTAQQQQGVGLGAAQANRAAIQQAGQQLGALGQQGYGQQLGAAQQMAGLGQALFGQGMQGGQALASLGQQQYGQGAQSAQQLAALGQQGYGMGAGTSQALAGLGTGAQGAALQGSQAQMAAGQVQQQTQQAQDTAQYQQFLQQRGYDFQTAQFLANIAMGTGALSGSTTTTQAPGGFFSDERLKKDIKEIGKTHDGQPIYSYKYKNDDRTQIGLMAQDVEKKHPEAVGLLGGYKTVDYKKATEDAERSHKDMGGGLVPDGFDASSMGGAVTSGMAGEGFERGGYVGGGLVGDNDWAQIIAANKAALGVYGGGQGPYGGAGAGGIGAGGIVPQGSVAVPKLVTAGSLPQQRPSGLSTAMQTGKDIQSTYKGGKELLLGSAPTAEDKKGSAGLLGGQGELGGKNVFTKGKEAVEDFFKPATAAGGLIVPRHAYADGGETDNEVAPYDPAETMRGEDPMKDVLASGNKKYELQKPGQLPGGGGNHSLGIGKMAGSVLGSAFGPVGSFLGGTLGSFLPFNEGGLVPRQAHKEGERAIPDYSEEADLPSAGAQEAGLVVERPDREKIVRTFLPINEQMESGGKNIGNPASSAFGPYQFTSDTFATVAARHPEVGYTAADHKNPDAQRALAPYHAHDLLNSFQKSGIDPSHQALRMGWAFGESGGPAFMKAALANPDAQGTSLTTPGVVKANPTWFFHKDGPNGTFGTPKTASETMNTVLGKFGSGTREAPVPPGLVGAGVDRSAAPVEGKKGLGETLTSEGFIVPALGFLGSMLASNRPNLGGALGEGILGGVGAYQAQRKMLPEIAKNEAEASQQNVAAINALSSGLKRYNALNGTNLTLQQFAKLTPVEIAKYAGASAASAVSGQNTSSGGYTYDPDEPEKLVIKRSGQPDIPAHSDPAYLTAFKAHWAKLGDDPYAQKLITWADKQLEESKTSTISSTGERIPAPGAIETAQKGEVGKGLAKEALDFNQEKRMFMQESPKILTSVNQIADIVSKFPTGADVTARANLDRIMKSIDPDNKFNLWTGAAGDYDTMVKNAMIIGLSQLKGLSPRAPAAELGAIRLQIPEGKMDPEAIRTILSGLKADVEYKKKMYNSFDIDKHTNVNKVLSEFMEKEPYDDFVEKTKAKLKPGAGTQAQVEQKQQPAVPQSSEALQWAKANPSDPRSAEILKRLGVQ
jgi:hypothetical protein